MKKLQIIALLFLLFTSLFAEKTYVVKMATVAPEGSAWMDKMHEFEEEIIKATNGRLKFKIYANGIMGSEVDILRKMRLGQLHSATFTGVGMGEIVPDVRVLDLPFLFKTSEEDDYVYNHVYDYFQEKFIEKGFFLVGWGEVGFIHLFTSKPVASKEDFKNIKMWLWKGDPLAKDIFNELEIPYVPLEVTDVYTSLQTGLIDGVYISSYGSLALQWFTKTEYIMDYPLTHSVGAALMTKKQLDKLPDDLQKILIDKTRETMREIMLQSRKDNIESFDVLRDAGLEMVSVSDEAIQEYITAGKNTRENLVGKLYSREILDLVIQLLEEYRSKEQ